MSAVTGLVESSSGVDATTAALEARLAAVEGRSIVSTYTYIMNTALITSTDMNQELVYHRYGDSSIDACVAYVRGDTLFQITQEGDYSISANL